jgi:CRISPR/Cas system-associated exonuclease Cas4 (RecB family)
MIDKNKTIYLSPSKLTLFLECPLCFWLDVVKGFSRPESPKSTLPRGLDLLIKNYFDYFRNRGELPPEIKGKVQGKLISNQKILNEWRSTYKNSKPRYFDKELNAVLFGGLDECLVDNEFYIPVDYKTRGFDLKEDSLLYYQIQLDSYTLLLEAEGLKHLSFGYLIYYIPQKIAENGLIKFKVEIYKVKTDPKRALKIFQEAVKTLRGPKPRSSLNCQFCSWGGNFSKIS